MADTVTTITVVDTPKALIVHLTCISDGTGETNVIKVDKDTIKPAVGGAEPTALNLDRIRWSIQGFTYIKLRWNHTTPDTMAVISNSGYDDFTGMGGELRDFMRMPGLPDPQSAGGTGDIELTSVGAVSGATYDITLAFSKVV